MMTVFGTSKLIIQILLVPILFFISVVICGRVNNNSFVNVQADFETETILDELRWLMTNCSGSEKPVQAYIIPMNDAHQSEYVSERDKRLEYVTKFTGSAGTAVVTLKKAALWTDSRYFTQAAQQIDNSSWILMKEGKKGTPMLSEWLIDNLPIESTVAADPFIISSKSFKALSEALKKSGHQLISIEQNLIDKIWNDRPAFSNHKIEPLPIKYSGMTISEKLIKVREKVKKNNAESIIVTALDEVAWLLNLRGSDIMYNPVFFSYVIITQDNLYLYVNADRITPNILEHFKEEEANCIVKEYNDIIVGVDNIVKKTKGKIVISSNLNQAVYESIPNERRVQISPSIIARMKTIKNEIEAQGLRDSHIRDGVALVRYLHWLDSVLDNEKVTEISGANILEQFRSQQKNFKGLSFESISAFGSNAAIVHYSPNEETNREITRDEIYLIDSGGQYWDGTTDVTRTVHFGKPTNYEKECFTRVLKGFIALVTSIFPVNTSLNYFDYVARRSLWQVGLNYGHGTGHGVGAFLNVHEYPPLISPAGGNDPGALEHMFTSNEPGYYKEEQFGIRLEDVVEIIKAESMYDAFDGQGALTFETITLVPIQTKMIDTDLLTIEEEEYINTYHNKVVSIIGDILLQENLNNTYEWLVNETKPIKSTKFQH